MEAAEQVTQPLDCEHGVMSSTDKSPEKSPSCTIRRLSTQDLGAGGSHASCCTALQCTAMPCMVRNGSCQQVCMTFTATKACWAYHAVSHCQEAGQGPCEGSSGARQQRHRGRHRVVELDGCGAVGEGGGEGQGYAGRHVGYEDRRVHDLDSLERCNVSKGGHNCAGDLRGRRQ
jgi:hypothetical protein